MAKSKEQKQAEALQRKRNLFAAKKAERESLQPGGRMYEHHCKESSVGYAELAKDRANQAFGRYLAEAKLNANGEPLAYSTDWGRIDSMKVYKLQAEQGRKEYGLGQYLEDESRGF